MGNNNCSKRELVELKFSRVSHPPSSTFTVCGCHFIIRIFFYCLSSLTDLEPWLTSLKIFNTMVKNFVHATQIHTSIPFLSDCDQAWKTGGLGRDLVEIGRWWGGEGIEGGRGDSSSAQAQTPDHSGDACQSNNYLVFWPSSSRPLQHTSSTHHQPLQSISWAKSWFLNSPLCELFLHLY